jgi:hypothetical protein
MTYDDVDFIREIYEEYTMMGCNVVYSAARKCIGKELLISRKESLLAGIENANKDKNFSLYRLSSNKKCC